MMIMFEKLTYRTLSIIIGLVFSEKSFLTAIVTTRFQRAPTSSLAKTCDDERRQTRGFFIFSDLSARTDPLPFTIHKNDHKYLFVLHFSVTYTYRASFLRRFPFISSLIAMHN